MSTISPLLTDLYQLTMMQAYLDHGMTETAVFEFFVRRLPENRNFLVAAGLQQVVEYLQDLRFTREEIGYLHSTRLFNASFLRYLQDVRYNGDVDGVPEGTLIFADEPLIRITAPLPIAQLVETRVINIMQFQTMVASKALRMRLAAPNKLLIDFGLRRAHGSEAGLLAARAAYLAGFDGTATVLAGMQFGIPMYGTMAHSYVMAHEQEQEAFSRYAASHPDNVILLVDTYDTMKGVRQVIDMASQDAANSIVVKGVRLDSGDLAGLSRQVRRALDDARMNQVRIMASSSLDEYILQEFEQEHVPIDGYGIGTRLTTSSDSPYLDCAYKLVEYKGHGKKKKSLSKATWPGRKQVFRLYGGDGRMVSDVLALHTENHDGVALVEPVMRKGEVVRQLPGMETIRDQVRRQVKNMPEAMSSLDHTCEYSVAVSEHMHRLSQQVETGSR